MKYEVAAQIENIRTGKINDQEITALLSKLRAAIQADPATGREYGQYIAQISQALKQRPEKVELNPVAIGKGYLAIGHKPGGKIPYAGMKAAGVSAVLTLLQENEGAAAIGQGVERAGMQWIWFPFSASRPHQGEDQEQVRELYATLKTLLDDGTTIYVHCSAGIHRTGMVSYGLLRYLGNDAQKARELLKQLREVTYEQVGEERLAWGDTLIDRDTQFKSSG